MNKFVFSALVILASFGIGVFVGPKILAHTAKPIAFYEETAVKVVDALQDEKFLQELASFSKESQGSIKKFAFEILKNLRLPEKNLSELKAIVAGYQELNDMFDDVNIEFVQQAWQSVAWEIVDGHIKVNPTSLNSAARKLAGQDSIIAPRLKKFGGLNAQWGDVMAQSAHMISEKCEQNMGSLFMPYVNFHAAVFKALKKHPRVEELAYQVHACLQWQHSQQLFLLALKDELINRMPEWLPKSWPYAKGGMIELGDLLDGLIAKQIKFAAKLAEKSNEASDEDEEVETEE
jgi:hypothetical protein